MATTQRQEVKTVPFFVIHVDGKSFGPFPQSKKRRFQALRNRAGVTFQTVMMDAAEIRKQKAESRKQKAESRKQKADAQPSLLDGTGFVAITRPHKQGF